MLLSNDDWLFFIVPGRRFQIRSRLVFHDCAVLDRASFSSSLLHRPGSFTLLFYSLRYIYWVFGIFLHDLFMTNLVRTQHTWNCVSEPVLIIMPTHL